MKLASYKGTLPIFRQFNYSSCIPQPLYCGRKIASIDNPATDMLLAYLADVAAATWIDLQRPDTRAGVLQLEVLGLLFGGSALEILDTPILPLEKPMGLAYAN